MTWVKYAAGKRSVVTPLSAGLLWELSLDAATPIILLPGIPSMHAPTDSDA